METDDKYKELITRIDKLSYDLEKYRQEINLLKSEAEAFSNIESPVKKAPQEIKPPARAYLPGLENFIGLNLIHFVGIIVLVIGLTIGVKHAIDVNLVSPVLRIILTYLVTAALFILSLKLKKKYELFSMILFSGAMAAAYFTTYAAYEYYALLPQVAAFVLMLLFTFFTVYTALKYNRQEIAILGLVGAYAIPFFVRGKSEDIVALFSYISFINAGVFIISFRKYWLSLTYISFFTTWVIYLSWLTLHGTNKLLNIETLFCVVFFILFLCNCLVFKILKKQPITVSDTFIVVADTICLYSSLLIFNDKNMMAIESITLSFGIAYLIAALIVRKYLPMDQHFYNALFSIALTAIVTFVGMKYSGFTVTILWVIMAVIMFITGMFYKVKLFRITAILLFAITLFKLVLVDSADFTSLQKVIAFIFTGVILLVVSFLYQKFKDRIFEEEVHTL